MIFLYDILLPKPFLAETDVRACTPFQLGGGGGVKNSEKSLLGGSEIFTLVGGGYIVGGVQSSHSVKWQESSQSCSSHWNLRTEEHKSLTSF